MAGDSFPSTKSELRGRFKAARSSIPLLERLSASESAASHLVVVDAFLAARTIALYAAVRDEADPLAIEHAALARGAIVVYPRVVGSTLEFCAARRSDLQATRVHNVWLPEPKEDVCPVSLDSIDLFVVPGVAFSRRGERLGYGAGYYDRALRSARATRKGGAGVSADNGFLLALGFAFKCQVVDTLPFEEHDQRVDATVTEEGWVP